MRALHHWPLDPFGRSVRAVLAEKKLEFESVPETPWTPSEALMRADPLGAGPVLIEDGAVAAVGARAAVEYVEETAAEPQLMSGSAAERAEIRRLLDWFERRFETEAAGPIRTEKLIKRLRGMGAPDMDLMRPAREAVRWHLDYVSWLAERRDWLAGRRMSTADLAAGAHFSSLDYLGEIPWADYPAAKEWYARVKSRPCFRAILNDRLPGAPAPAHYADLDF
jgi:glutathione S-transferase